MTWTESRPYQFRNYFLHELGVDQAWLNLTNLYQSRLWLYELSKDCFDCPFKYKRIVDTGDDGGGSWSNFTVSTKFPMTYRLYKTGGAYTVWTNNTADMLCEVQPSMGEFGVYKMTATEDGRCTVDTELEPVSIYLSFIIPIVFYILLAVILLLFGKFKNVIFEKLGLRKKAAPAPSDAPAAEDKAKARVRLRSLDTFRGICIVIMIFVNDGAARYYFLEHATWDGLYVSDLVFPWFLWIMGACIPISIKSQVKRNTPKFKIFRTIVVRSLKLIAIGVMLNTKWGTVPFKELRLPGVLQRFGFCYFVAATSVLICADDKFITNQKAANKFVARVQDIFYIWKGWLITIACVLLYIGLTFFLEVPGCPTGYLGPGGFHEQGAHPPHCIGGAAGHIDRKILTEKHIYKWPTAGATYEASAYDPEGILGTLTSIFTVWLGVQAGLTLQVYPNNKSRLVRWAVWAVVTGAIGAGLCEAKMTGGLIPLNKNLWSLSYVLVLGCMAMILLIVLYVVIDILKWWSGTPFFEPGMNSILLYIGHSMASTMLPWHFSFERMDTHFKLLVEALWGTSLWVIWAIYLFHIKYFWSL